MIQKINLSSTLAALILFFLPWISIQCSQKTVATQTGIQAICGGASLSNDMKSLMQQVGAEKSKEKDHIEIAPLVGIAFLLTIAAFALSIAALSSSRSGNWAGIAAAVALLLLVTQIGIGFPAQKSADKQTAETKSPANSANPNINIPAALFDVRTNTLPWFYLELVALGIPVLLLANKLVDKRLKQNPEATR